MKCRQVSGKGSNMSASFGGSNISFGSRWIRKQGGVRAAREPGLTQQLPTPYILILRSVHTYLPCAFVPLFDQRLLSWTQVSGLCHLSAISQFIFLNRVLLRF